MSGSGCYRLIVSSLRSRGYLGIAVLAAATVATAYVGDLRTHTYVYLLLFAASAGGYLLSIGALKSLPLPVIVAVGLALRIVLIPTEPTLSDDYHRYIWDGMVQEQGFNPYRHAPDSPALDAVPYPDRGLINHPSQRTLYPPLIELIFRGLVRLGGTSALGLKCAFGLFDLAIAALLAFGAGPRRAQVLGLYLLHPMVMQETWGSAHFEAVPVALMVAAALLITRGRDLTGGLALGLGAAAKLYPALMLIPALLGRRARPLPLLAGFAVGAGVPYLPYLASGGAIGSLSETGAQPEFNSSVFFVLTRVVSYDAARVMVAVALVAGIAYLSRRMRGRARTAAAFAWTATLLMLLSPVVHPWYWVGPIALGVLAGIRLPVLLGLSSPASYATYAQTPFSQRLWARVASYLPLAAPSADLTAVVRDTRPT
jgi:alpha-1,6-mannosyltransferase